MKSIKVFFLSFFLSILSFLLVGCWNYRELEDMNIVAGTAIDKGINKEYMISMEILEPSIGEDTPTTSRLITSEGDSIFDAVRNAIAISGQKLYWSHNKVLILSKEIAQKGIIEILDWFHRDSETRSDVYILISKENTAKEILENEEKKNQITSFNLQDILANQKNLSKAPDIQIWKLTDDIINEGITAIAPAVKLTRLNNKTCPEILATAVFKNDKLIGFLDESETRSLLFLRNKIKGGLLDLNPENQNGIPTITLEIFESKTKIQPVTKGNELEMNVNINTIVSIAAIKSTKNFVTNEEVIKLEKDVSNLIKANCKKLIEKMQSEYGADIFGFGAATHRREPALWKKIGENWENVFENLKVHITVKVKIKNSAMTTKPIEVGD